MREVETQNLPKPKPPPPLPLPIVPDELIWEILLFLPVKSLMRLRCVYKSWKLIISDSHFVKLHLRRSLENSSADIAHIKLLSEVHAYNQPYVSYYYVPLLFSPQYPESHRFHPIGKCFNLLGVCNGLVSFKNSWNQVCFWNPAIRLWSQISPPLPMQHKEQEQEYPDDQTTFGFGYDGVNDTYKVVAVSYYDNDSEQRTHKVW
ncbi:F-box/kelch-repeat protein At3g23880-like [Lotus japonicus]|uniref:F-box/kelch-repeat protein At3g23880-like n=1 Tax=Lotus japonicus TaxID=34305 RepID=UPI0025863BC8|nr:F-box/kelch-repeat protein At3g23880-like [Lotus japonicus]